MNTITQFETGLQVPSISIVHQSCTSINVNFAMVEYSPACFEAWRHTTTNKKRIKSSTHATINLKYLQERGDKPYMAEGDVGKLATPLSSNTAAATKGQEFVAEVFPAFKAGIGQFPNAV